MILIYAKFPNNNFIPVAGNWNRNRWWKYYWNQIRKHNQIDWNRIRNQKVYRNRWRWIQPRSGFNQSEMASGKYARVMWRFPSSSATARDGEVNTKQAAFLSSWRDHLSSRVKWCNNQTVRNVYMWMQQYLDLFRQNNFHVSYRRHMPATLNWPRLSIDVGCQRSDMAALLYLLSFAFTNSFLPKYRVKYYEKVI